MIFRNRGMYVPRFLFLQWLAMPDQRAEDDDDLYELAPTPPPARTPQKTPAPPPQPAGAAPRRTPTVSRSGVLIRTPSAALSHLNDEPAAPSSGSRFKKLGIGLLIAVVPLAVGAYLITRVAGDKRPPTLAEGDPKAVAQLPPAMPEVVQPSSGTWPLPEGAAAATQPSAPKLQSEEHTSELQSQ